VQVIYPLIQVGRFVDPLQVRCVDADLKESVELSSPFFDLRAGFEKYPGADFIYQPGFLGDRDENAGNDYARFGVLPTQQCFRPGDAAIQ